MIDKARIFATQAHKGQKRKSSGNPYIIHPILVAQILLKSGCSDELVCAGYLHDTLEDTDTTPETILKEFGKVILDIILLNTEDKSLTWEERKTHTIESLKQGSINQKYLVVADKFANLMELARDKEILGEDQLWSGFKRGKDKQGWYFNNVYESAIIGLDEIPQFFKKYKKLIDEVF